MKTTLHRSVLCLMLILTVMIMSFSGCKNGQADSNLENHKQSSTTSVDNNKTTDTGDSIIDDETTAPGNTEDTGISGTSDNNQTSSSKTKDKANTTPSKSDGKTTTKPSPSNDGDDNLIITIPTKNDTSTTKRPDTYDMIYAARGVAIAGLDFGGGRGDDFVMADQATYTYFANKGFDLFRVAITWERIQPTLGGSLSSKFLGLLKANVQYAKNASSNAKVVIDIHNYAKYDKKGIDSSGGPTTADFIDLWEKLSNEFKNDGTVYAYGLMNEPVGVSQEKWFEISQKAVTAIRRNGDKKLISVCGPSWAGAHSWPTGSAPWINDPEKNIMYEAHQYFDRDCSGTYEDTYADLTFVVNDLPNRGVELTTGFVNWCNKYKVRGFIGEFGVPNNDARWMKVLDNFMKLLQENGVSSTYWAGGTGWGNYPLSIQPRNGGDAMQMATLVKYRPGTIKVYR